MFLPPFNDEGMLPEGTYDLTIDELRASHLVTGEGVGDPRWDTPWRGKLVENLAIQVRQLREVGIERIYAAGSFVEAKSHPNDIDGCFDCDVRRIASGELLEKLNEIDPYACWTWDPKSRRRYRGYPKGQLPMWHRYRVEMWPDYGQPFGVVDAEGNHLGFQAAFRRSRTGAPRGILKIRGVP